MCRTQRWSVYGARQPLYRQRPSEILGKRVGVCVRVKFDIRRQSRCGVEVVSAGTHQRKKTHALPVCANASMIVFRNWPFSSSETFHSFSHRSTSDFVRARISVSPFFAEIWKRVVYVGSRNAEDRGVALNKLDNLDGGQGSRYRK